MYRKCKEDNKCYPFGGDTNQLHAHEIKEAAEKAKKELGESAKLKYDPTKNLPKPSTSTGANHYMSEYDYSSDDLLSDDDSDLESSESSDSSDSEMDYY